ncbi:MAG: ATP-binding cassette protein [Ramlibacter sp.]|nr:ATP-binding cassette protein [Ramlibacter sp.]
MPEAALRVVDLAVSFDQARVLDGVSLTIRPGSIVGLVAPNGAGKTTTLRAISGIVPRSGQVWLGERLLPARPDVVAAAGVAHVPEGRRLLATLTVEQNLRLAAVAVGQPYGAAERDYVLSVFPALEAFLKTDAALLSGGQQQMVAIARGLVAGPRFLMVDEVSLGLAPKIVKDLLRVLERVARSRGIGLLLVDQNVRALSAMADEMYVLRDGRAEMSADTDALVELVYFGGKEQ